MCVGYRGELESSSRSAADVEQAGNAKRSVNTERMFMFHVCPECEVCWRALIAFVIHACESGCVALLSHIQRKD